MHAIRDAQITDAPAIVSLLEALDYPGTDDFIKDRLLQLINHPDERLLVSVENEVVTGVISLHFIPQLALAGDFCRISYLCVSGETRGKGTGKALEEHAVHMARQRGCDRIEVHCHSRRTDAHRFYGRQGYAESPKYLCKSLKIVP
ncbi:GNAT family N-acetyltransferase [Acerihabitans sp. TG2]|uniref:GNAT family N-acetyltransferase n=1 Tax=Acerihabitans sp. TG2 TaxID=3096008 RepID=UPI002B22F173|nr:GNAT family N-acetyltransferase [Acerihabitans sp. TG2]MEA9390129.1 GNAT family N-acetyltransferase [Acerihabitans sp. TG2]